MTTHGTPIFHLYPNLPRDIQTVILNDLSFTDLVNFCSIVRAIYLDEQYFQQRLVSKFLDDPFTINRYQSLVKLLPPKDAYVKTLIDTKQVNRDPTILIYLDRSTILFPGLEYFIGLTKMGQRAIDLNRSDYLLYVLQLYPNSNEIQQIFGALYLKYMNWIHDPKTKDHSFPLLDQSLLHHLFQVNSQFSHSYYVDAYESRYYPRIEPDYQAYREGLHGLSLTQKDRLVPYFYGLIDGRQVQLFADNIQLIFVSSTNNFQDSQVESYVAKRGTLEMVKAMLNLRHQRGSRDQGIIRPDTMFFAAVHGDNVPIVDFLLTEHRGEISPNIKVSPRSLKMLDLLRSHDISVLNEDIFTEALQLGNYALLFGTFGENWYESMTPIYWFPLVFERGPAYLMSVYFMEFRKINELYEWHEPDTEEDKMGSFVSERLTLNRDLYREEILLSLGYKPDDEAKEEIIAKIEDNDLVKILGLNLDRYPHLLEIYHKKT